MDQVKLAYIILVHHNVDQANILLSQMIADGDSDIYIHLDRKTASTLSTKIMKHDRIHILPISISVYWGDISMIDATLLLFHEVINTGKEYDYICLRSGQDLIVRNGLMEFLSENRNKNFIIAEKIDPHSSIASSVYVKWPEFFRRRYGAFHPCRWLRSLVPRLFHIGINICPNKHGLPAELDIYRGSQWFCLSFDAVKYIIMYLTKYKEYYRAFIDSFIPDMWFFQTIIMNSPYASTVVMDNLTYIRMGTTVKGRNHPITITAKDIDDIEKSGYFFARKFDIGEEPSVIYYYYDKILGIG